MARISSTTLICLVSIGIMFNTGCASILCGTTQAVRFTSSPDAASYELVTKNGEVVHRGTTPETVTLKRGRGYFLGADLTMRASKDGYGTKEKPIRMYVNVPYVGGNLIFGGLIGWVILDPLTGGMFSFPESVFIDLSQSAGAQADEG